MPPELPLNPTACPGFLNGSGRNGSSRQGCIEKRPRHLEIGKYGQVFVAQIAGERTVDHLAICRRQRWRESGEVKGNVVPIARGVPELCNASGPHPGLV